MWLPTASDRLGVFTVHNVAHWLSESQDRQKSYSPECLGFIPRGRILRILSFNNFRRANVFLQFFVPLISSRVPPTMFEQHELRFSWEAHSPKSLVMLLGRQAFPILFFVPAADLFCRWWRFGWDWRRMVPGIPSLHDLVSTDIAGPCLHGHHWTLSPRTSLASLRHGWPWRHPH